MAEASYPEDLLYHAEHDWARIDGEQATLGITWYAQDQLGEVVFFDPPATGTSVSKDAPYAEVESVKAVSDVIAPLSGEIVAVNESLGDDPSAIKFLGWTSKQGEECGDFPVFEAAKLTMVFQEVKLATGAGTVPVQFQYSNHVHGPEGPVTKPDPKAHAHIHAQVAEPVGD